MPSSSLDAARTRAFVEIQQTAEFHLNQVLDLLKPHGISPAQYNVLRILRGAEPAGLPCSEIGHRMISRDPDITRLLDRLEKRELAARARQGTDRRVITVRITPAGLALLAALDEPVQQLHRQQFSGLSEDLLAQLTGLLQQARQPQFTKS